MIPKIYILLIILFLSCNQYNHEFKERRVKSIFTTYHIDVPRDFKIIKFYSFDPYFSFEYEHCFIIQLNAGNRDYILNEFSNSQFVFKNTKSLNLSEYGYVFSCLPLNLKKYIKGKEMDLYFYMGKEGDTEIIGYFPEFNWLFISLSG